MQIPPRTELTLQVPGDRPGQTYTAVVLGPCPWGMRLTVPKHGDRLVSPPAKTQLRCALITDGKWMLFDTVVVGYERTSPPAMVVAPPQNLREDDRRRALRLRKQLDVVYSVQGDPLKRKVRAYSIDISSGGMQLSVASRLEPGTKLNLEVSIPDHVLTFTAEVMWAQRFPLTAGVRFYGTRGTTQALWDRFLFQVERELRILS